MIIALGVCLWAGLMSSLLFNANICSVVDCGIKDMTKNLKKKKKNYM